MPDIDFENINGTTFSKVVKEDVKDRIEIEVGDEKQLDFKPQYKIKRWDNEVNFSIRAEEKPGAETIIDGNVIKYVSDEQEVHFYEKQAGEDGGFEFEWLLKEKPKSNVLTTTIQSKGLEFLYQPPLTEELAKENWHTVTPTEVKNKDGMVIVQRPENVVGSYAAYHTTKGRINSKSGKDYKAGKAFHIFRPEAVDAQGNKTWCNLQIDEERGLLTVEIDQSWLDAAVYPVVVDPTFGTTSIGASNSFWDTGSIASDGEDYSPSTWGLITTFHMYGNSWSGNPSGTCNLLLAAYQDSSTSSEEKVDQGADNINSTEEWKEITADSGAFVKVGTNYHLAFTPDAWLIRFYDSGGSNDHLTASYTYTGTAPDPVTWTSNTSTEKWSEYLTYDDDVPQLVSGSNVSTSFSSNTETLAVNVGSAANRALVVAVMSDDGQVVDTLTYNGTTLTKITAEAADDGDDPENIELWYLVNPASGSNTLAVDLSGGNGDYSMMAAAFSNVKQGAPASFSSVKDTTSPYTLSLTGEVAGLLVVASGDVDDTASNRAPNEEFVAEAHDIIAGSGAGDYGAWLGFTVAWSTGSYALGYTNASASYARMVGAVFSKPTAALEINVFDEITVSEQVTVSIPIDVIDAITVTESITILLPFFPLSVDDAVTVTEQVSVLVVSDVSVFDGVTVSETVVVNLLSFVSVNDAITVTDVPTVSPPLVEISVNEAITVTEQVTLSIASFVSVNDAISITEDITVSLGAEINVFDAVTVVESVTANLVSLVSVNDTITVSEDVTVLASGGAFLINVFDAITVTESVTADLEVQANVFDAITVTENVSVDLVVEVSVFEAVTVAESVDIDTILNVNVFDAVTVAEAITTLLQSYINAFDGVTVSESVSALLASDVDVSDEIVVAEAVTLLLQSYINVSDAITVAEDVTVFLPFHGAFASEDITVSEDIKALLTSFIDVAEAITVEEDVTAALAIGLSVFDGVAVAEQIATEVIDFINVSDEVSVTEVVQLTLVSDISIFEAVTVEESVSMLLTSFIDVSEAITVAEDVTVFLPFHAIDVFEGITVAESVSMASGQSLSVADAITVAEQVQITLQGFVSVFDAISVAEVIATSVELRIDVSEAITVAEDITMAREGQFIDVFDGVTVADVPTVQVPEVFIDVSEAVSISEFVDVLSDGARNINVSEEITVSEFQRFLLSVLPTDTYLVYGETGNHLSVFVDGVEVARFKDDGTLEVNGVINENAF